MIYKNIQVQELTDAHIDKFFASIKSTSDCWLWNGIINDGGYGVLQAKDKNIRAHRIAYELFIGEIPSGLHLDHLCRVRHCVNPTHLEPVTQSQNNSRGDAGLKDKIKTHCPRGHEYTIGNMRIYRNKRHCRQCHNER